MNFNSNFILMNEALIQVEKNLGLEAKGNDQSFEILAAKINDLLNNDFQKLISILYRMDISEKKLRSLLANNPGTDAGLIIAEMMVARELQKIQSRKDSRRAGNEIDEEEKW